MIDYVCTIDWNACGTWVGATGTVATGIGVMWIAFSQYSLDKKKHLIDTASKYSDTYKKIRDIQSRFELEISICTFLYQTNATISSDTVSNIRIILSDMQNLQSYINLHLPAELSSVSQALLAKIENIQTAIITYSINRTMLTTEMNNKIDTRNAIDEKYKKYTCVLRA